MRETSEIREPDALTAHVRIYEGPRVNAARLEYCDTTRGNGWPTVNTNPNLNQRDLGLLTAEPRAARLFEVKIVLRDAVNSNVRRL